MDRRAVRHPRAALGGAGRVDPTARRLRPGGSPARAWPGEARRGGRGHDHARAPLPATAAQVAADLGIAAGAFDVNAACAGFVYGLVVGTGMQSAGAARTVLLVGADTMTSVLDPDDRSTAVLFGDGAAATVLVADPVPASAPAVRPAPVLASSPPTWWVTPRRRPAGRARRRQRRPPADTVAAGDHHLRMDGREVFRRAVRAVEASIGRTLDRAGATPATSTCSSRTRPTPASSTPCSPARASTPPASSTDRPVRQHVGGVDPARAGRGAATGTVAEGDLVLLCGFGAGLTVGTALWRWGHRSRPREIRPHEHRVAFVTGASGGIGSACGRPGRGRSPSGARLRRLRRRRRQGLRRHRAGRRQDGDDRPRRRLTRGGRRRLRRGRAGVGPRRDPRQRGGRQPGQARRPARDDDWAHTLDTDLTGPFLTVRRRCGP